MKQQNEKNKIKVLYVITLPLVIIVFSGCPIIVDEAEYERGFNDGFAQDDYYWT